MFAVKYNSMQDLRFILNPVNSHVMPTFQEQGMLKTECKSLTHRCGKDSLVEAMSPGNNRDIKLMRSVRAAATCNKTKKKNTVNFRSSVFLEDCKLIKVAAPYQNRPMMDERSFAKVSGQALAALDQKQAWRNV